MPDKSFLSGQAEGERIQVTRARKGNQLELGGWPVTIFKVWLYSELSSIPFGGGGRS